MTQKKRRITKIIIWSSGILILLIAILLSLPFLFRQTVINSNTHFLSKKFEQFPVTVDPKNKIIAENKDVNAYLSSPDSPLQAAVGSFFWDTFEWLATAISDIPWYNSLASVEGHFIDIRAGMRKEQVAAAFGKALSWNTQQKKDFLTAKEGARLPLDEGSFAPGIYFVSDDTTPSIAQDLINNRFTKDVLLHYGSSTEKMVPLEQALTVASLIERESGGYDDMRMISGVIWNRLFSNMNLQIDATLQYVKASNTKNGSWWPAVVPADKYKKSAYNTYKNLGLPPTPIATPSVAAILAALNPLKTACLFYFHDKGTMYCSENYQEHVKLLKKIYGKGK